MYDAEKITWQSIPSQTKVFFCVGGTLHQILGLRNELFDREIRAASVHEILKDPEALLGELTPEERVNLFFTVFHAADGPEPRVFEEQDIIPFDIDNVEEEDQEEVLKRAIEAIGAEQSKVGSLRSGNGVQFFVQIENPIKSMDYFDAARSSYKILCLKINNAIRDLSGKADPSVFSKTRIMRMPGTINRKQGKKDRQAYVIQPHIEPHGWTLEVEIPGAGGAMTKHEFNNYPTPDEEGVLEGCGFISHCRENPNDISEAQWYGLLGIVAHLPNGKRIGHELSEGYENYSEEETDLKIDHAKQASGPRTCENIESLWNGCKDCPHFGKIKSPITIQGETFVETESTYLWKEITDKNGNVKIRPAYEDMIKYWRKKKGPVVTVNKTQVFTYNKDKNIWERTEPVEFKSFIRRFMNPKPGSNITAEAYIRLLEDNYLGDLFDMSNGYVNLANGVFEISTGIIHPFDKKYGFRNNLGFEYDETADCPRFKEFLQQIQPKDSKAIDFIQEYMGYIVSGDPCWAQKGAVFYGSGANGKSTLNDIIRHLVGTDNISSISMKRLSDPQYYASLDGVLVNIADENSVDSLADSDSIKAAISGDAVQVKNVYEKPYSLENKAKFIFNCNTLPYSRDKSDGLYRRLIILTFPQKFNDENGNVDRDLKDKLLEELPGIFNFAIDGYRRLMKVKRFTEPDSAVDNMNTFKGSQNDIEEWYDEFVEQKDGEFLPGARAFRSYNEYCQDIGKRSREPRGAFNTTLKELSGAQYKRVKTGSSKPWGFVGIRLKDSSERSKF